MNIIKNEAVSRFPQLTLIMGSPKVGKSTIVAQLPKALVVDLESTGYSGIDVPAYVKAQDFNSFHEVLKYFFSVENTQHKILVIDHIRQLTSFFAKDIIAEHGKRFVEEVEYGKGTAQLKMSIERELKLLRNALSAHPDKYIILVGHSTDKNGEVRLDIDGKNESLVLGLVDGIGYISRDPQTSNTMISFNTKSGVEAGIRNKFLANYAGVLATYNSADNSIAADWQTLFKVAEGKTAEAPKTEAPQAAESTAKKKGK